LLRIRGAQGNRRKEGKHESKDKAVPNVHKASPESGTAYQNRAQERSSGKNEKKASRSLRTAGLTFSCFQIRRPLVPKCSRRTCVLCKQT
jgi:hypothetical protein